MVLLVCVWLVGGVCGVCVWCVWCLWCVCVVLIHFLGCVGSPLCYYRGTPYNSKKTNITTNTDKENDGSAMYNHSKNHHYQRMKHQHI